MGTIPTSVAGPSTNRSQQSRRMAGWPCARQSTPTRDAGLDVRERAAWISPRNVPL